MVRDQWRGQGRYLCISRSITILIHSKFILKWSKFGDVELINKVTLKFNDPQYFTLHVTISRLFITDASPSFLTSVP